MVAYPRASSLRKRWGEATGPEKTVPPVARDGGRLAVAAPPEAMPVASLIDGDPVNPGPKARLAPEPVNDGEDAHEHFLRKIQRLFAIAEQVGRQLDDHALVFSHQFRAGRFVARCTALHERRFAAADVQPTADARLLHRKIPS